MPRPLGFLSPRVNPDVVAMLCTAGHVDHGKTSLVKMLTGCNTDRLKEEQERGMTIELGFAPCFLGGNLCVGVVDVPGHEKFIKNMVAGVSGIAMTVLVIAADDGVMPQTIEHLQIMQLMGVRRGIVALTKIDLVAPERIGEVSEEIRAFLKGTFLEGAPIIPASSETLDGFDVLHETLIAMINSVVTSRRAGVFRMPIERTFPREGFGAVVTGIPVDGVIRVGDGVELVPGGAAGHVRGIQRFLREANAGGYGQCLALNVPEFGKVAPVRGQVVCAPGYLREARCFHVSLRTVWGLEKPLANAEEIKFHTGTSEEPGKIYLLEHKELAEQTEAFATILLANPVAAAAGDRFIARRPSPAETIAGGEILAISYREPFPRRMQTIERLRERQAFFAGVDPFSEAGIERKIEYYLLKEKPAGAFSRDVARATMLPIESARETNARLVENKKAIALAEDHSIHADAYRAFLAEVESRIEKASKEEQALSLTLSDLRKNSNWPAPLWNRIQQELESRNLIKRRGDKLTLQAAVERMSPADRALLDRLINAYEQTGFASPRPEELPALVAAPMPQIDRILQHLYNEKLLIKLADNVVLSQRHFRLAQDMVVKTILEKGLLNSADFKHQINSTRKYALAILDYLDARRVTVRVNNDRRLAPDFRKHLL